MRYPRTATLLAMFALAMVAMVPAARAQSTVGTITQIQGVANIQRGAQNIAAAANMPVLLHDKIVTQPGASLTIGMVDNSSLQLGPNATLSIDESVLVNGVGAPSKVGLLGGKLHSLIVGAMRGSTTTFEVHTPNAIGAVRGTEWTTAYTEEPRDKYKDCRQFTDVDVQDGTVNVINPLNPAAGSKDVHAGHHTTVACGAIILDGEEAAGAGVGGLGATALGIGIVAGGVIGGLAASGAFDGGGGGSPPVTPSE
jgi:hypothetical protein